MPKIHSALIVLALGSLCSAELPKILINHLGYEPGAAKHAVVLGGPRDNVSDCALVNSQTAAPVLKLQPVNAGAVKKWRNWNFWTLDFDSFRQEGRYYLTCKSSEGEIHSFHFAIEGNLFDRETLSDVIYYFKDERSSGPMDEADRHLHFDGQKPGTLDAHGGWWDATGDYGKHLSHLSFSTYFNPQQIPLVVYSLLKSKQELDRQGLAELARYKDRMLDEAMFGADYLVRMKDPSASFYRSVTNGGVKQVPEERKVAGEMKKFGIYQTSSQEPRDMVEQANNDMEYEVSYRSGGGMAIAALALASTFPTSGEFHSADYLKAAEDAFDFLEQNNLKMVNDGKENIVDDYCALAGATELYKATHEAKYKEAADRRANNLVARLVSNAPFQNYWLADDGSRPFFHASDAGLPDVSLLYYTQIADRSMKASVLDAVRKSLETQLAWNAEVTNPFDYARQLVQDKTGSRHTSFFFPHNSDAAPWWQGENARLASLAAAARLASREFPEDPTFQKRLQSFAVDQLNWILGLNPFDSCMMYGVGRNNPEYMFFDSWEFTNAPGGISNGITSGFKDEDDIDYNLNWHQTGADNDWRWQEQWLPHAAWYLLAVSVE